VSTIYLPATSADQWAQLLADPEKHWKTGYSARTLAHSWQDASGFPTEVRTTLTAYEPFREITPLLALPEHQVPLPGGTRPSQTDIWVLARVEADLVSIAVEGKVAEPFGPTLDEWLTDASAGKNARLEFIRQELGLPDALAGTVRYQLLHRTASAVVEAKRFNAAHAVMLVHSFSQDHQWFADFADFAELCGVEAQLNRLASAGTRGGVELHLAWVRGDAAYLQR
jgi:hypothetical protein